MALSSLLLFLFTLLCCAVVREVRHVKARSFIVSGGSSNDLC